MGITQVRHLVFALASFAAIAVGAAAEKRVVFIAGRPSHGPGEHEHRAGCLLLKECLGPVPDVVSVVYSNGWPTEPDALRDASTIVVYSDGGTGHPLLQEDRLKIIGDLMNQGVGLVLIHYAVEPTRDKGQAEFLDWVGGAFEIHWSVNPHWNADFGSLPEHPITRGVSPFNLEDEWYFHMRFRDDMLGVTPILTATPPENTTKRNDGPHEGNPVVRELVAERTPQHVAWAMERADGGRGFGITGGHFHRGWANDDFRKLVLNAILWTARMDVPAQGVISKVSPDQFKENLDPKGPKG